MNHPMRFFLRLVRRCAPRGKSRDEISAGQYFITPCGNVILANRYVDILSFTNNFFGNTRCEISIETNPIVAYGSANAFQSSANVFLILEVRPTDEPQASMIDQFVFLDFHDTNGIQLPLALLICQLLGGITGFPLADAIDSQVPRKIIQPG